MAHATGPDRNLALEAVRTTEAAAIAAWRWLGRGDEEAADRAAVEAMRETLHGLAIDGTIVVGEPTQGAAGKLIWGERVGLGSGPDVAVALLALEGPTIIAKGESNGLSVIAMTENGGFLPVPHVYMKKIAVGPGLPAGVVDVDASPADNLKALAKAKGVAVGDLVVCTLDRPRHQDLIAKIREAGARILLIADGDVSAAIAAALPKTGVDLFLGIGNAPQGVLAAAALVCVGGQMQARLVFRSDAERAQATDHGIAKLDRKYTGADMAWGDVTFAATGITDGHTLAGVRPDGGGEVTHSLVLRSSTGTLRYIEAHRKFGQARGAR